MLHGIGGRTIAEAKQAITFAELQSWAAYIEKHGSLNLAQHIERGFAMLALQVNRAIGGKAELTDFMPHYVAPPADINDVFALIMKGKK